MVVVAAEAKTTSRSLIAISDVEGVFNDEIVKELTRTAKLPVYADIARLAQNIRNAAHSFLKEKAKLNFPQQRTAIERLYQLNTRAEDGDDRTARALARAVDAMPAKCAAMAPILQYAARPQHSDRDGNLVTGDTPERCRTVPSDFELRREFSSPAVSALAVGARDPSSPAQAS